MNKAYTRIIWENEPSIRSPLNDVNLNKMDSALDTIDNRVISIDTSKADQADLLLDIKDVAYDTTTGIWTFTKQNGTTITFDQNIEKIPVSFSMDANGVITMTTADGTQYTADVGSLIKLYSFIDSTTIDFTVTEDASGNKSITADVIDGSITGAKLQPNYLADITTQATNAAASATSAGNSANDADWDAKLAQSYAIGGTGIRQGEDTDNAKYYKEQAAAIVGTVGHVIVDSAGITMPTRSSLQFLNGFGTDDSTNDITKISIGITDSEWTQIEALLA